MLLSPSDIDMKIMCVNALMYLLLILHISRIDVATLRLNRIVPMWNVTLCFRYKNLFTFHLKVFSQNISTRKLLDNNILRSHDPVTRFHQEVTDKIVAIKPRVAPVISRLRQTAPLTSSATGYSTHNCSYKTITPGLCNEIFEYSHYNN